MDLNDFESLYRKIFISNGLDRFCNPTLIEQFYSFTGIFLEANQHLNLTAIRDVPNVIAKHYVDCLLAEPYFPTGATVLDVGCGGGFPTFPLAIARPDLKITALDSTLKKINFVNSTAQSLGLHNVHGICARAEDTEMRKYRESFDVVTSRAVANLRILTEITLPFVKPGGQMIALKGSKGKEELEEAQKSIELLGGRASALHEMSLQVGYAESRCLILISKMKRTTEQYPRQYSAIVKKPL